MGPFGMRNVMMPPVFAVFGSPQGRIPRSFVIPTTHDFGRSAAPIGQGLGGREFPGGVVAGRAAAPPADPGVLRFRAHRRRHRRPRDAARGREARAPRSARGQPARPRRHNAGRHRAARGAGRARPVAAARAGSAQGVPAGRHQAALRRLGRPDRLLPLFGDAGRPLRARRAWREPRRPGRRPTRLRGAADHQSPAGLRARTTATSTGSMSRSMRSRRRAPASRRWARRAPRRTAAPACTALPTAPAACWARAAILPARSRTCGSRWKSRSSSRWRGISCTLLRTRDPLSERVHLGKLRGRGVRRARRRDSDCCDALRPRARRRQQIASR